MALIKNCKIPYCAIKDFCKRSINLLCQLQVDLTGYNFSHLAVWQAYLKETTLHNVNFQNADLTKSIFLKKNSYTTAIAFSANGKILATGGYDGVIRLWRVADGQQILAIRRKASAEPIAAHQAWIHTLAFSPISADTPYKNGILASGGADFLARCWNVDNGEPIQTFTGHTSLVFSVNFSRDATTLTTVSSDLSLKRWNIADGRCLQTIVGKDKQLTPTVAYSSDGKTIAIATAEQTLSLWNLSTGKCFQTFPTQHNCRITALAFSPDGSFLASGSTDGTIKLWDVSTGRVVKTLQGNSGLICSVVFSPVSIATQGFGQTIASCDYDGFIRIWNVDNCECEQINRVDNRPVFCITFCPTDSNIIASPSFDNSIKLWSVNNSECKQTLQGHTQEILSLAWSRDGKILVSSSLDETIKIWNVKTGNCLKTLRSPRPLEGTNITGVTGITQATVQTLENFGAINTNSC